jgi:hypothetical protein
MFGFLKKLFGFDKETMKEAGVQVEQASAPYKVPEPTTPVPTLVDKVAEVNSKPIEKPVQEAAKPAPAKKRGGRKPAAKKETAPKKEPAKRASSSRKPKTGA